MAKTKVKATEPETNPVVLPFVAIEPLRVNGVDIAPGETFTTPDEVAAPLLASGAAIAAEQD